MNKERKRYIESCEVSRLVRYELGGVGILFTPLAAFLGASASASEAAR
ncbi:hypothetical protein [Arabiibacter massiliensis]|nr:hypothetical protein [Arabiibacter massiliensis]